MNLCRVIVNRHNTFGAIWPIIQRNECKNKNADNENSSKEYVSYTINVFQFSSTQIDEPSIDLQANCKAVNGSECGYSKYDLFLGVSILSY